MQAQTASGENWRDGDRYSALLDADRSLFAWEWLRRDPAYRNAALKAHYPAEGAPSALDFGLVEFEDSDRGVPDARPLWDSAIYPSVLQAGAGGSGAAADLFNRELLGPLLTICCRAGAEHMLISDGLRSIRLDAPPGVFTGGPTCLRYNIEGLAGAEPAVLTLRRFLALCRLGRFKRALHRRETRARRWVLMLRAFDALAAGAGQIEIADALLNRSAGETGWRRREPSLRSQTQRLVRAARSMAAGSYRILLR